MTAIKSCLTLFNKYIYCCIKSKKAKRTRRELRAELLKLQQQLAANNYAEVQTDIDDGVYAPFDNDAYVKELPVLGIQRIVRGFIGRRRAIRQWLKLVEEADRYWLCYYWLKAEEEKLRRLWKQARKEVKRPELCYGLAKCVIVVGCLACRTICG
jgi:hypothetical protein